MEIIKKKSFGEANISVGEGLGTDALSSFETAEGESPEGCMFDDAGKVKEKKGEKEVLEDKREPNGQIKRVFPVGAKFLLFIDVDVDVDVDGGGIGQVQAYSRS